MAQAWEMGTPASVACSRMSLKWSTMYSTWSASLDLGGSVVAIMALLEDCSPVQADAGAPARVVPLHGVRAQSHDAASEEEEEKVMWSTRACL